MDLKNHMSEAHPEKILHIASRRTIESVSDDEPTYVYIGQQEDPKLFTLWKCKENICINTMDPSLLAHNANRRKLDIIIEADELYPTDFITSVKYDSYIPKSISLDVYKQKFPIQNIAHTSLENCDETINESWTADTVNNEIEREIEEHMSSNSFEKLICKFCIKYIKNDYVGHLKTHHTHCYKCANCQHFRFRKKNDSPREVAYEMVKHFNATHKSEKVCFYSFDKANKKMLETRIEYQCNLYSNDRKCGISLHSTQDIDHHFSEIHPESNRRASSVRKEIHALENIVLNEVADEFQATGCLMCETCKEINSFTLNKFLEHGIRCKDAKIKYKRMILNGLENTQDKSLESIQSGPIVSYHCLNCSEQPVFCSLSDLFVHYNNDHANEKLKYTLGKMVLCKHCKYIISTHNIFKHYSEVHSNELQAGAFSLGCRNRCGFCTEHISMKHCLSRDNVSRSNKIVLPIENLIPRYESGTSIIQAFACNSCEDIMFKTIPEMVRHVQFHRIFYCTHCKQHFKELRHIVSHQVDQHQMSVDQICELQQCIKTFRDLCQYAVYFCSGLTLGKELLSANVPKIAEEVNQRLLLEIVAFFQTEKSALDVQN